MNRRIQLYSS